MKDFVSLIGFATFLSRSCVRGKIPNRDSPSTQKEEEIKIKKGIIIITIILKKKRNHTQREEVEKKEIGRGEKKGKGKICRTLFLRHRLYPLQSGLPLSLRNFLTDVSQSRRETQPQGPRVLRSSTYTYRVHIHEPN